MKKTNTKKEIPAKTVVKGLITGFVSYGIILAFLLFVIESVCYSTIDYTSSNARVLTISLPLFFAIIQFLVIRLICRLSTVDLFKKCRTKSDNLDYIEKKMYSFFIILAIIILVILNFILYFGLSNFAKSIEIASTKEAKIFSEEYTKILKNEMLANYNEQKSRDIVIFSITELSLILSFVSLIPYQKKMILEYNEIGRRVKKDDKKVKEKTKDEETIEEQKIEESLKENESISEETDETVPEENVDSKLKD
jgi:hypothetical protein